MGEEEVTGEEEGEEEVEGMGEKVRGEEEGKGRGVEQGGIDVVLVSTPY